MGILLVLTFPLMEHLLLVRSVLLGSGVLCQGCRNILCRHISRSIHLRIIALLDRLVLVLHFRNGCVLRHDRLLRLCGHLHLRLVGRLRRLLNPRGGLLDLFLTRLGLGHAGLCGSHPNDGGCRVHGLILSDEGIDHFLLDLAHRAIRKDDRTVCIDIDLNFFAVVGRSDLTNGLTEILCIVHLEYLLFMKS